MLADHAAIRRTSPTAGRLGSAPARHGGPAAGRSRAKLVEAQLSQIAVEPALPSAGSASARSTGGGNRVLKPLADPHRERSTVALGDRLVQLIADLQRDPMTRSAGFSGTHARSIGHPGQSEAP
jgi:hypothetical protein